MGSAALPTILQAAEAEGDSFPRSLLLDIAARIGDPRARPALERQLTSTDPVLREAGLDGVGRLGLAASAPALRAAMAQLPARETFVRLQFLEALYRVGEVQALGEVVEIGKSDSDNRLFAAGILLRHPPLRAALGIATPYEEDSFELVDDDLLLPAAEEWYLESVLGQPSPWRQRVPVEFTPPCAAAKCEALGVLGKTVADGNDDFSNLRVLAVDPAIDAADGVRSLTVLQGAGHGRGLSLCIWQPGVDAVRCHVICVRLLDEARSTVPGDRWALSYRTFTMTSSRYLELIAGLRTVLEARLVPWWHGLAFSFSSSWASGDFVTVIQGLDAPERTRYCGYPRSSLRSHYEALRAATCWHDRFLDGLEDAAETEPTPESQQLFSAYFRSELSHWRAWWWVRMLGMAAACGDATLREPLAGFLTPEFTDVEESAQGTAWAAATALASITGVELRFAADGSVRPIAAVAAAYRELLAH